MTKFNEKMQHKPFVNQSQDPDFAKVDANAPQNFMSKTEMNFKASVQGWLCWWMLFSPQLGI